MILGRINLATGQITPDKSVASLAGAFGHDMTAENLRLRQENERLRAEVAELKAEIRHLEDTMNSL